jgi:DICT domain-containing protein
MKTRASAIAIQEKGFKQFLATATRDVSSKKFFGVNTAARGTSAPVGELLQAQILKASGQQLCQKIEAK